MAGWILGNQENDRGEISRCKATRKGRTGGEEWTKRETTFLQTLCMRVHTYTHTHTLVVRFSSRERAKNLPLLNKESELVFAIRYDFPWSAFASWLLFGENGGETWPRWHCRNRVDRLCVSPVCSLGTGISIIINNALNERRTTGESILWICFVVFG